MIKIKIYLILVISVFTLSRCANEIKEEAVFSRESEFATFKPTWTNKMIKKLPLKFGDYLAIKTDSNYISGILVDFQFENNKIYYGFCLTNMKTNIETIEKTKEINLFATRIASGFENVICKDCFHIEYINKDSLDSYEFKLIKNFKIDINKTYIGAFGYLNQLSDLNIIYKSNTQERKKNPTECGNDLLKANANRACYIKLADILE